MCVCDECRKKNEARAPVPRIVVDLLQSNGAAFGGLMLLVGRQEGHPARKKTERWGAGVLICLERGADLHTVRPS